MPEPRLDRNRAPGDAAEQAAVLGTLTESHRAPWQHAVLDWQGCLADARAGARRWEMLVEERMRAEKHLESQLRGTRLGQLVALAAGSPRGLTRTLALGLIGGGESGGEATQGRRTQHRLLAALLPEGEAAGSWEHPPEAPAVGVWWDTLTPTEREAVVRSVPAVVGNLPGLPASVRDRANRLVLEWCRSHPHLLSPEQLRVAAAAQEIVTTAAAQHTPDPPVQVLALELSGGVPKAAIGYGALDTATHLTWQVPGMHSDAAEALYEWDAAGRNLYQTERSLLWREGAGAPGVIAWLGYDTPGLPPSLGVLRSDAAVAGAGRLAAELDGMASARLRSGRAATTTVVAHSYGTTVASLALAQAAAPVQSFVMLGSAGLDTTRLPTLEQLRAAPTAVYATNARRDLLAPTGAVLSRRGLPTNDARAVLGLHEHVPVYGGIVAFPSEGDPSRGLRGTNGHSVIGAGAARGLAGVTASEGRGYGDLETQSLMTTARIATQTLDPRTVEGFSPTEAQRVREFVDTSGGRKTFVRVPALKEEQR